MAQKLTNVTGIDLPMAVWLLDDNYDHVSDPDYISATGLLKPLKEIILSRENDKKTSTMDISMFGKSQMGSAMHDSIENAWMKPHVVKRACALLGISEAVAETIVINPSDENVKAWTEDAIPFIPVYMEQRVIKAIEGFKIGGKFDIILAGALNDYKSTGTFTYTKQSQSTKYIQQGSIYRWLNQDKVTEEIFTINYYFTDWVKYKMTQAGYPPSQILSQQFTLMSLKETEAWITEKLRLIKQYSGRPQASIPVCTDEDLWRDLPEYKYYSKPDAKRATKVFGTNADSAYTHLQNQGFGEVKIIPSVAKACNYCSAHDFCDQRKQLTESGELSNV